MTDPPQPRAEIRRSDELAQGLNGHTISCQLS